MLGDQLAMLARWSLRWTRTQSLITKCVAFSNSFFNIYSWGDQLAPGARWSRVLTRTQSLSTKCVAFSWLLYYSHAFMSKLLTHAYNIKACHIRDRLCAEEEIRTPTPGCGRYHLKVVRLPISPPPLRGTNLLKKTSLQRGIPFEKTLLL